ncbi:glutathione S-transferase family protein [Salinisphaera sp. Q1T1-3]|uniref:glutathione S-transferase family protein n=1 Tax=Salinisphaera sp. Q1T1-3 TaxID=2321229 RepID=UPI000E73F692|nr:glutathione S-transferase family protein [Salinisphaera sp. Q1T1-3]RJS91053.1 glutathione S-transferase family protein [Salinisphaera sp. Q1T1-3]
MILHHFEASPFSEKIRLVLGHKRATWHSVHVPRILPKPDLMPLTGGYRRTPVLQIGRDIYADTRLIVREIDRRLPTPPLVPAAQAVSVRALESLGDQQMFLAAIPVLLSADGQRALTAQLGADGLAAFRADRAALFASGDAGAPDAQFSASIWQPSLMALEAQLAGRAFVLGAAPTLADFALYHPVWYVRGNTGVADALNAYPAILAWAERMAAIGHGNPQPMESTDALAVACDAPDFEPLMSAIEPSLAWAAGQRVQVAATDYGSDPVEGQLVHADTERVVIEREAAGLGRLRNHFPRHGFHVAPAGSVSGHRSPSSSVYTETAS